MIQIGDIIQIDPDPEKTKNRGMVTCFGYVTEVFIWGIECWVQSPGEATIGSGTGRTYLCENGHFKETGGRVQFPIDRKTYDESENYPSNEDI